MTRFCRRRVLHSKFFLPHLCYISFHERVCTSVCVCALLCDICTWGKLFYFLLVVYRSKVQTQLIFVGSHVIR